ncbi:MAG TPA: hypothetical protein VFH95_01470, partial [Candidatus Kapabacteria bacterium]|nr:hypothetical protein [Candidatus Kapabacteria bacterium]
AKIEKPNRLLPREASPADEEFMLAIDQPPPIALPDGTHLSPLPRALYRLRNEIESSQYIYELNDDWDQEGSKGVSQLTWIRAIRVLVRLARELYDKYEHVLEPPQIAPYPDGGITLYWRKDRLNILVHIPSNETEYPTYSTLPSDPAFQGRFDEQEFSYFLFAFILRCYEHSTSE